MVYDKIKNWKTYAGLSEDICIGLDFLSKIQPDIEKGVHELTPRVKAIVSEYTTKKINENGYEAHRDFVDIQYLISGTEKICCLPLEYLKETKTYRDDIDAAFYEEAGINTQAMLFGNGYFAIFYPQDGHMPGLCWDEEDHVKKVVVKIKIND